MLQSKESFPAFYTKVSPTMLANWPRLNKVIIINTLSAMYTETSVKLPYATTSLKSLPPTKDQFSKNTKSGNLW